MNNKSQSAGVRHHLRQHGENFLTFVQQDGVVARGLDRRASALERLLIHELRDAESCHAFWDGIEAALQGCPRPQHFEVYPNILAYGFVHLLDRYLRTWEILKWLVRTECLPVPKNLIAMDVGSGPAPAMYAVSDFYAALRKYATLNSVERLSTAEPNLRPVELSEGTEHFFHSLTEFSQGNGPVGAHVRNFSGFDPRKLREDAAAHRDTEWNADERCWDEIKPEEGFFEQVSNLHRYQLVIFSNFLTRPEMIDVFKEAIQAVFREQQPGGVVVVMGAVGAPYPEIYDDMDVIAAASKHTRVKAVPSEFNDDERRPYFARLKQLGNNIWTHLVSTVGEEVLDKKTRYPPFWDASQPLTSLRPFAVRVYATTNGRGSPRNR